MVIQSGSIEYDKSEGRALRLLELYFCIEENPGIKADELTQKFGVSPASLYRDIQSLKKMGLAIDYTSVNRGGYRIERGSIRFLRVKPSEVRPLLIAQELLGRLSFPEGELFEVLLQSILGTIREGELERTKALLSEHLYLRAPLNRRFDLSATEHVSYLTRLLEASMNRWTVAFTYAKDKEEDEQARKVNPLGLWFGQSAWYLAGWCHERKALRTFAVDRIQELQVLEEKTFQKPHDFNLSQWVETSWIATPANSDDEIEEVVVAFDHQTGRRIAGAFWHESQSFDVPDDRAKPVLARFRLSRGSIYTEFKTWVLGFGNKATCTSHELQAATEREP